MANDISLLKLAGEAVFTTYIQPVCLPTQASQVPVGTTCWITGWGETQGKHTCICIVNFHFHFYFLSRFGDFGKLIHDVTP